MGKITGFLEYERSDRHYEPVEERIKHWREFVLPLPEEANKTQAARCMDCADPEKRLRTMTARSQSTRVLPRRSTTGASHWLP